jgi:hypothetical protein
VASKQEVTMDTAGISAVLMGAAAVIGATAQLVKELRRSKPGGEPPEDAEEEPSGSAR